MARKPSEKSTAKKHQIVGETVIRPLASVKPNDWNPNEMTPFEKESLKHGLQTDGWIASQALLIWGTDEKGSPRDIIIDGEHRWTVANELGFQQAPMVFMNGLTAAEAKAFTLKIGRRGKYREKDLGALLREIQRELDVPNLPLEVGIDQAKLAKLLAEPAIPMPAPVVDPIAATPAPDIPASNVRMAQLFFDERTIEEYNRLTKELAVVFGAKNATDVVLEALRRVYSIEVKGR